LTFEVSVGGYQWLVVKVIATRREAEEGGGGKVVTLIGGVGHSQFSSIDATSVSEKDHDIAGKDVTPCIEGNPRIGGEIGVIRS
jgi:hypothetical protein